VEFKTLSEYRPMKAMYNLDTVFLLVVCGVSVKNNQQTMTAEGNWGKKHKQNDVN
jgi:hypothetical protein